MLFHVDVSEELRACCVPMLYIAANRDIVVPARNLRLIQQIKPDIQIITIPSPHAVVQARSAQVSEAITNFIISLARQSASDPSV
jgi:pimeloyl-ACP methyl ester carboxylesterase